MERENRKEIRITQKMKKEKIDKILFRLCDDRNLVEGIKDFAELAKAIEESYNNNSLESDKKFDDIYNKLCKKYNIHVK